MSWKSTVAAELTHTDTTQLTSALCRYANWPKNDKHLCNQPRITRYRQRMLNSLVHETRLLSEPKPSSQLGPYRYRSWLVQNPLAQYSRERRAMLVHTATSSVTIVLPSGSVHHTLRDVRTHTD
jgi:hypothetical protein